MDHARVRGIIREAEIITDADRIRRIFGALGQGRIVGRTVDADGKTAGFITALRARGQDEHVIRWDYDGVPWNDGDPVEIAGLLSLFRFELEIHDFIDGRLITKIPRRIERVRHRNERRVAAPEGAFLRYRTRDDRPIFRELHDVSRHGLSFNASASRDVVAAGVQIRNAVIDWQGRLRVRVNLTVRHVSEDFGEGRRVAGATLSFASDEDAEHWHSEVGGLLDPRTRLGGSWTNDTWELYEKSGYFSLSNKDTPDFQPLRRAFADASRKLGRAPQLGAQIVWPSARGVEASVSVIGLNHHAVFLYHVARRHGNPPEGTTGRTILYDIYERALTWIHRCTFARWLVVWVQDAGQFSKRLHLDFVSRNDDGIHACVVPFRALEIPTRVEMTSQSRLIAAKDGAVSEAATWSVRPARLDELEQIGRAAVENFPPAFVEALALTPPFERRWDSWDDTSLMRGRDVVVAVRDERAVAAGIMECAEDGLHLFGLLDVLRIIPLGPPDADANTALIQHARHLFGQLGKRFFVYACDADVAQEAWPEDAIDLGLTHCTVMSTAELLPQFTEHAWELTMSSPD
ncbi:MAG: hypothetical protein ABI461_19625 [Polyangiaceae bacterium]